MKKTLLALAAVMALGTSAYADTASVTFSNIGLANSAEITGTTVGDATVTFSKGTNNNTPKYYTTGNAVRLYGGNTLTVSVPSGFELTEISFTVPSGNPWNTASTASVGTFSASDAKWTGNASSVTLTQGGTSGHARLESMTVTYTSTVAASVETPVIAQAEDANTFSLSCATDGASIYYTLDGTEPTAESALYTEPVAFGGTTTVKAIAIKGTDSSRVASATLTAINFLDSLAEILNLTSGEKFVLNAELTAFYQSGVNLYVTDGKSNMLLYGNNAAVAMGQKFSKLEGSYSPYANQPEVITYTLTPAEGEGTLPAPKVVNLADLTDANILEYVIVKSADISGLSGKKATISQGETDFVLYNSYGIEVEEGENFDVTGFVTKNNSTLQFAPISIVGGKVMETVATPEIAPESGELTEGDLITITCATEGAKIYYTLDGTVPTEESTLYEAAIEITEAMTVKAIAYAEEMLPSAVASASYTLYDPNAPVATEIIYNFATAEGLGEITFSGDFEAPAASKGYAVNDETLSIANTCITFDKGTATTDCRIWGKTSGYDLRTYANSSMTIGVSGNYKLAKVVIDNSSTKGDFSYSNEKPGTYADKTWTAPEANDINVKEITLDCTGTTNINSITITLDTIDVTTAVEAIEAADEAPVYYNLQGVRVANPEKGLYIVVKGNKSEKVIL